jgi:hypothetical protein
MTKTMDARRQVEAYKGVTLSAFANFSGLPEAELRVGLGGARELLRAGAPASAAQIAKAVGLPTDQVADVLWRHAEIGFAFLDEQGQVVAMWGIGGPDSGHTFQVDGPAMPIWCSIDTLLHANWLDVTAKVASRDPLTKRPISFTVSPDGVEDLSAADAVVSAYEPDGPITNEVKRSFCHYVHFFESAEAGELWAAGQGGRRFTFLPIDVAFAWARDFTRSIFDNLPGGIISTQGAPTRSDAA